MLPMTAEGRRGRCGYGAQKTYGKIRQGYRPVLPRFQDGDNVGVLPYSWEVLRKQSRVEYRDEEG